MLPIEVIIYIYEFNVDHRMIYEKCLSELKQKNYKKRLQNEILIISYGPIYKIPNIFKKNINIYPLLNILRL